MVIAVANDTLNQSIDMLWTFASPNEKTSRAVQHARTLKIKYLLPMMALDQELFPVPQHYEPESQDPSPSLIRRLAYAISSLKQRVK